MGNILHEILENRKKTLEKEILSIGNRSTSFKNQSRKNLSQTIRTTNRISIISEIKPASPSLGEIRTNINVKEVAEEMENAGVDGLSVLTEPSYFHGSYENLQLAVESTSLPCLMKDFVFDMRQFQIAKQIGATNILLINSLGNMEALCEYAYQFEIEPLIEIHEQDEIEDLVYLNQIGFKTKLIGVNNRDLRSFKIDLNNSKRLIPQIKERIGSNITVISESGISSKQDIDILREFKADGFLIGSSIMLANKLKEKILELRGLTC
ncbi:MAG: indole-3-glycerol-phosphate synthase [Candidatus Lokiarchaeota archaeon]|nr:indole-3-glycerol-phosphate synthase [Candidatus Lokiarchaeota archaeon]